MSSPSVNLDAAINGLQKNLANAVATASQLSRDSDEITSAATEAADSSSGGSGSAGGPGSIIDVTA
ncbi:hypothetical protein MNBD_GAMMA21-2616 [hydrothermal vent metagenome]|uniref:Motility protein n=1 Tax=hydrothermal vent metagenome TaxID=652676 RepID=A0A3B1AI44_9ZZZZ